MPDPVLIVTALGVAATAAAVVLLICGWPWRAARTPWFDAGWVLGVGAGFVLGCWVLGIRPHWPPREDQDRLLALVLPAILVVELLATFPRVPRWLIWPLRSAVAASGAGILLFGSSYLTDVAGPGTREWSPVQAWLILGGLAAALAADWVLLAILARRAPGLSHAVCLSGTSAGAALTVMLSGYATGGQVGLPLAAALLGAAAAVLVLPRASQTTGPIGVAIVGLFSLLVIGRFFGQLTSAHAILLFCAPLLGWLPELPYLRRLRPWARGLTRVILVGALVSAVVVDAQRKFVEDSNASSGAEPEEPSIQDDKDLGR
ncbi:MAG: hypothetical protein ACHRXM_01510 [Isosphaerales bacterium]